MEVFSISCFVHLQVVMNVRELERKEKLEESIVYRQLWFSQDLTSATKQYAELKLV